MSEDNKRAKCPVCGRFAKAEAVDEYNKLLSEHNMLVKERDAAYEECGVIRKDLSDAQELACKAQKRAEDYEGLYIDTRGRLDQACADVSKLQDKLADAGTKLVSMQSELNELHSKYEKLCNRSLWERIRNKRD